MQKTGGDGVPAKKGDVAATVDRHEKALLQNDLSRLSAEERKSLYWEICESTGLNPSTQPLEYIYLNGDLTLYANKTAAAQLRDNRGISITELEEEQKWGLFIVRAYAKTADGRTDVDEGSVALNGQKGEALANVRMKAITKAKRRVTLSISGMGFLDRTEVSDVPSGAKQAAHVDHETGEIKEQQDATHTSKTSAAQQSSEASSTQKKELSPAARSRSYLQKASATGNAQTLSDAIDTVRTRADEKLEGKEADEVKRCAVPFEAIGHLRASVQGDFDSIDEGAFNAALDWFAQQTDGWPGDELQWAQKIVGDEAHHLAEQVPGFEITTTDEDGPFETEKADEAVEAMQSGETALGSDTPHPNDDLGIGEPDPEEVVAHTYDSPEAAIQGHFSAAIRAGKMNHIPEEERISGAQLDRMYAIADDEGWKDTWLDRMVKDELGFESKSYVPTNGAYEEIISALQDDEMRFWMSRDADTGDLFDQEATDGDA